MNTEQVKTNALLIIAAVAIAFPAGFVAKDGTNKANQKAIEWSASTITRLKEKIKKQESDIALLSDRPSHYDLDALTKRYNKQVEIGNKNYDVAVARGTKIAALEKEVKRLESSNIRLQADVNNYEHQKSKNYHRESQNP
jgi:molecular chaperone GrpE (heat shock protein)